MMRTRTVAYVVFAAALFTAGTAAMTMTGVYDVPWRSIDAGGGESSSGSWDIATTFGQTDTRVMQGEDGIGNHWTLAGGFWPGATPSAGDPTLVATLAVRQEVCPAPFNPASSGVVSMVLTGDLDVNVSDVMLSTLELVRADGIGETVHPYTGEIGPHILVADLNQPNGLDVGNGPEQVACSCGGPSGPDGINDLEIPFLTEDIVELLYLEGLPLDTIVVLTLRGELADGTPFQASDCISIAALGSLPGTVAFNVEVVGVEQHDSWLDVAPGDATFDGGGFGYFERSYDIDTVLSVTTPSQSGGFPFVGWRVDGQLVPSTSGGPNLGGAQGETLQWAVTAGSHLVTAVYGGGQSPSTSFR